MATVFGRIWAYHKKSNAPVLPIEDRQTLGNIVRKEFFTKFKLSCWKQDSIEDGVKMKVLNYHPDFTERLDKLILNYYRKLKREQK